MNVAIVTLADRLLLAQLPAYEPLRRKLERAVIVSSEAIPPDVATMDSRVRYTDGAKERVARLAYPAAAGAPELVSILSPLGAALLGLTQGQSVDYVFADGRCRRLKLEEVLEQPERTLAVSP